MIGRKAIKKIPAEVLNGVISKLDEVISMLDPYLVVLTLPERQGLIKIGDGSFSFLELSHEFAVEYPDLFPAFMEAAVFKEEFFTVQKLWSFFNKLSQLRDNISDTKMAAGSHALDTALAFYQTVKIAARCDLPGARVIYEELKPKVPARRQRRKQYRNEGSRTA